MTKIIQFSRSHPLIIFLISFLISLFFISKIINLNSVFHELSKVAPVFQHFVTQEEVEFDPTIISDASLSGQDGLEEDIFAAMEAGDSVESISINTEGDSSTNEYSNEIIKEYLPYPHKDKPFSLKRGLSLIKPNIRIDSSAHRMMVKGDPNLAYYHQIKDEFGSDNVSVIYARDENIFTPEKLKLLKDLRDELEKLEGVVRVNSLFNSKNFKYEPEQNALATNPLMSEVPSSQREVDVAKNDALRSPLLKDRIVSEHGMGIAINVIADPDSRDVNFNKRFSKEIDNLLHPLQGEFESLYQIGMPLTHSEISKSIIEDSISIIALSFLIVLILLVVGLRTLNGAFIPIVTGGMSVIWTFGFMAIFGIPVQILTVIVPSMILVLGATEDMHIISEYFEGIEEGLTKFQSIDYLAKKCGIALFLTSVTTVIGFASILLNDMTLLWEFGFASSVGLAMNFIITITVGPAYLRCFGGNKSPFDHNNQGKITKIVNALFNKVASHSIQIVSNKRKQAKIICFLLFATCIYSMSLIKVDNDLLGYFKESSDIRVRSLDLSHQLTGSQNFFLVLEGDKEDTFKNPEYLHKILEIQEFIKLQKKSEEVKGFDSSLSFADHIAMVHREQAGKGKDEFYTIPDSASLVSQYAFSYFTRQDLDRYVSADYKDTNIVVRHALSSSWDLKIALDGLKNKLKEVWEGTPIKYRITSESILINDAAESIAVGQAKSISLLMFIIFVIMCLLFVNIKAGLLSLIPNALPVVVLFGIMGILDIPLNPGTAMISAIAIGIAVDDTIHFMVRYNKEMKGLNDQEAAMKSSIIGEVRPVVTTSIGLAAGFASLAISDFVPIIYFGVLSAVVMVFALVSDLLITPMLLVSVKLITLWDMVGLSVPKEVIDNSPLFKNLKKSQIKKIILLGHLKDFSQNESIIKQGDRDRCMYLILDGSVRVELNHSGANIKLTDIYAGEVFGEVALIDSVERTANVLSNTESTRVLAIDWKDLENIRRSFPGLSARLFLNISRILGKRLAETSALKAKQIQNVIVPA